MLAAELIFYKHNKIIHRLDDEDYGQFNSEELQTFVSKLAKEIGASRVVENRIYHHEHGGIVTTIYPPKEKKALAN